MSRYDPPIEIRPNAGDHDRADELVVIYSEAHTGMAFSRTDLFRMALAEGFEVLRLRSLNWPREVG